MKDEDDKVRRQNFQGALQSGVGLCYQVACIWRDDGGSTETPTALVLHEVVMHLRRVGNHLEKEGSLNEAERVGRFASRLSSLVNEVSGASNFPV